MECKKVYLLYDGIYSDTRVVGVYSSKEKAEEYMKYTPLDEPRIIEKVLDSVVPDKGMKTFLVWFKEDEYGVDCHGARFPDSVVLTDKRYNFFVNAMTCSEAIKIASERLAIVKAEYFRFPLLEKEVVFNGYRKHRPFYHFYSGKILLEHHDNLLDEYKNHPHEFVK